MSTTDKCPHGIGLAKTCSQCEDDRLARALLVEKWRDDGVKHIANQVLGLIARLIFWRERDEHVSAALRACGEEIEKLRAQRDEARTELARWTEPAIRHMEMREGSLEVAQDMPETMAKIVAGSFIDMLDKHGAQHYVEMEIGRGSKSVHLTIRRPNGKSPATLQKETEQERDALRKQLFDQQEGSEKFLAVTQTETGRMADEIAGLRAQLAAKDAEIERLLGLDDATVRAAGKVLNRLNDARDEVERLTKRGDDALRERDQYRVVEVPQLKAEIERLRKLHEDGNGYLERVGRVLLGETPSDLEERMTLEALARHVRQRLSEFEPVAAAVLEWQESREAHARSERAGWTPKARHPLWQRFSLADQTLCTIALPDKRTT